MSEIEESGPDTLKKFAKRMALRGVDDAGILAVAFQTRWASSRDEIRRVLAEHGDRWRKAGKKK